MRELIDLWAVHSESSKLAEHDCHNVFAKAVRDLRSYGLASLKGKRVLDLGCGQRYPFALLAAAAGAQTTALDVNYIKPEAWLPSAIHSWRHNGPKRAIKNMVRRAFFDEDYYRAFAKTSRVDVSEARQLIRFVVADETAAEYDLPANTFDLINANAVLEHIRHLRGFAAEVARLLAPGGLFFGMAHNYYSLSGGHDMQWWHPSQVRRRRAQPWDHLLDNKHPTFVYLNRARPEDYESAFAASLTLLAFEPRDESHDFGGEEGRELLTPTMRRRLAAYSDELLLTRAWCLVAQKP